MVSKLLNVLAKIQDTLREFAEAIAEAEEAEDEFARKFLEAFG